MMRVFYFFYCNKNLILNTNIISERFERKLTEAWGAKATADPARMEAIASFMVSIRGVCSKSGVIN